MNKFKSFLLYPLIFLVFVATHVQAQNSNFISYGIEDGLAQSQIETVVQDNEGNLWIGTIGGLNKYNGQTFETFRQKDGLAEDWITATHKSSEGSIWYGHWGGGVSIYQNNAFEDLHLEKYSNYKLITSIGEDQNGNIWFGTDGAGVFFRSLKTGETARLKEAIGNNITFLLIDRFNILWIGTDNGLIRYDIELKTYTALLKQQSISSLQIAYGNELWVGTKNNGIYRVKLNSKDIDSPTISHLNSNNGLLSNQINTLYFDRLQNVWIATKDKGIIRFNSPQKNSNDFVQGEIDWHTNKYELKYNYANTFFMDREENLWIGTEIGLNKYVGDLFTIYNENDGLPNNLVWSMIEDTKGFLWMSTTDGVAQFNFESNRIDTTNLQKGPDQNQYQRVKIYNTDNGLPENIVVSLFEDSDKNIWFGTENRGAAVLLSSTQELKSFNTSNGLMDNNIFSINEDNHGNIWLGTKKGASKLNLKADTINNFTQEDGLGGNHVYSIFKDSKGILWFGILGGGLTKYENNAFYTYTEADGLKENYIVGITEDSNSNLWLAAYGDGIVKYDHNAFTSYNTKDGLSSNSPQSIVADAQNNIWIGMSLGIEKFDPKTGQFKLYSRKEGFLGNETNGNAILKDSNENIWFSSVKGAIKFSPDKEKINPKTPLTYLRGLQIYHEKTDFPQDGKFAYNQNYLTFSSIGISLKSPKRVLYKYKLEGSDEDWSPPTKESEITYTNLTPGKYTLKIKACNSDGLFNQEPTTYSFEVLPPFWQTWWFYLICVLGVISGLFLYIKWRERELKATQIKLEGQVEKRTLELKKEKEIVEEKNKVIHQKNTNITSSINYAKRIQEAILVPVEEIKQALPNSFIFYQPKDIVSGDFYWMHKHGDQIIFAAVDCTGHGVPGAFMSIIGTNLLERVVDKYKIYQPSIILEKLNHELWQTLRVNSSSSGFVNDGMDMAICSLNIKSKTLEFAGARNPMYIIRNNEVLEFKSDKKSIGEVQDDTQSPFANHQIPILKDDFIYLFSDGFPDQKGGEKRKKFYYKPFKKLLLETHLLPIDQQREHLKNTIDSWKGDVEQIDDMLIFGVKI